MGIVTEISKKKTRKNVFRMASARKKIIVDVLCRKHMSEN